MLSKNAALLNRTTRRFPRLARFSAAALGPAGGAAAQFLLTLAALRALELENFGKFSFMLVLVQGLQGVWGALFATPLAAMRGAAGTRFSDLRLSLAQSSLVGAVLISLVSTAAGLASLSVLESTLFAAYLGATLIRWQARADAFVTGRTAEVLFSDGVYCIVLAAWAAYLLLERNASLAVPLLAYGSASVASLALFGKRFWSAALPRSLAPLRDYRGIWKAYSRWSLFGVVTTEATTNAHSYLVVLLVGAGEFSVLAASALAIRPISVALNALGEYERARMGTAIANGQMDEASASLKYLRDTTLLLWLVLGAGFSLFLVMFQEAVFRPEYDRKQLVIGASLWLGIALVRTLRMAEGCYLQAAGQFRGLAMSSLYASIVSVIAVAAFLIGFGTMGSMVGLLLGEVALAFLVRRMFRLHIDEIAIPAKASGVSVE